MAGEKQDANLVGFYKTREAALGIVPSPATWRTLEPNSFDDFGADYTKTARRPFSASRQRRKGSVTDLDASGGFNQDVTQNNSQQDLEDFFFAHIRATPVQVGVAAAAGGYTVASSAGIPIGSLVIASGFVSGPNNGLKVVTAVPDATHVNASGLVAEGAGPEKQLKVVGFEFPEGDLEMTAVAGGTFLLTSTAKPLNVLGLIPGSWVFIGGDAEASSFEDGDGTPVVGYARIAVDGVSENAVSFDKATFPPLELDGAGKKVRLFFGDVLKNEDDPDDIVRFSSVLERTLGKDADGTQSEYLIGAVANEMTWNSPLAGLVTLDMGYVGIKSRLRKGIEGPLARRPEDTLLRAPGEDAFNTSSNIYRIRMTMVDPNSFEPTPFFARVTEWSFTVANNVTVAKAQGVLGGFDTTAGGFDVDGEVTAYFQTVEAIHAIQCNYDVTFDAIYAKNNAGIYLDVPLISNGGGRLEIEQDAAIMIPIESAAAESPFGHTLLMGWFPYLPNVAMPDIDC